MVQEFVLDEVEGQQVSIDESYTVFESIEDAQNLWMSGFIPLEIPKLHYDNMGLSDYESTARIFAVIDVSEGIPAFSHFVGYREV